MKGVSFPQANRDLVKPDNMTEEECYTLPVFSDGKQCISRWELTEEELKIVNETKSVWLHVLSGHTQPPVLITTENPFTKDHQTNG